MAWLLAVVVVERADLVCVHSNSTDKARTTMEKLLTRDALITRKES